MKKVKPTETLHPSCAYRLELFEAEFMKVHALENEYCTFGDRDLAKRIRIGGKPLNHTTITRYRNCLGIPNAHQRKRQFRGEDVD